MKKIDNKRHSSRIDIIASIVVLSLVVVSVFLFISITKEKTNPPLTNKSNKALASTVTDSIDSKYPGIKIITEISNDESAPFALQYPQSEHSSFNKKVNTYVEDAKDNYLNELTEHKQQDGKFSSELNISFETFSHHSGMYSFVLVNSTYTGGENGSTEIVSFRLNPKTGKHISIEDVFNHDLDKLEIVAEAVREKLVNDEAIKDYLLVDEMNLHTKPIWTNFNNFALTNDSIVFYFDKYKLADGAAGVPIISIPIKNINELLAAEFKFQKDPVPDKKVKKPKELDENPVANKDEDQSDSTEDVTIPPAKQVALTFDDGPDPKVTTHILSTLKKYNAKATFFMLGSRVEYYPEIAKNVEEAGHEIGNHTWNHPDLTKASIKKINKEITSTSSIIKDVTGKKATVFRPPYGAENDFVRAQTDLPSILWDVDTMDWKHRNADQLLTQVKKNTKDGSIILMHDIHQSTADGLDAVLDYLKSEGYTFVTVSELN